MTTLLFIRHGQTDWNAAGRWQGHADIPLNETGLAQADALARRLAKLPLTHVYTSDLQRAKQTGQAVATLANVPLTVDGAWRERSAGIFEGMNREQLLAHDPDMFTNGVFENPPKGETQGEVRVRIMPAYEALLTNHPDETIAIISHGGTIHILFARIMGLPDGDFGNFSVGANTGVNRIEISERGARVTLLNDDHHIIL